MCHQTEVIIMKDFKFLKKLWCGVDAGESEIRDQIPSDEGLKLETLAL